MPSSSYERVFIQLFNQFLPSIGFVGPRRYGWMRNPKTGNKLELDLYNEKLRLAIEVNGPQHYRGVPGMATPAQSLKQQARDTDKLARCKELKIHLYSLRINDANPEKMFTFFVEVLKTAELVAKGRGDTQSAILYLNQQTKIINQRYLIATRAEQIFALAEKKSSDQAASFGKKRKATSRPWWKIWQPSSPLTANRQK